MKAPMRTRGVEMKIQTRKRRRIVVKGRAVEEDCDQARVLRGRRMMRKRKPGRRKAVTRAPRSQEGEVAVSVLWEVE